MVHACVKGRVAGGGELCASSNICNIFAPAISPIIYLR